MHAHLLGAVKGSARELLGVQAVWTHLHDTHTRSYGKWERRPYCKHEL